MNYQNWNISAKLGLVLILFLGLIIVNFLSVYLYTEDRDLEYDLIMQKAGENPLLLERIASINTNFIYKGDTDQIREFHFLSQKHNSNSDLLLNGGYGDYLGESTKCAPIGKSNKEQLERITMFWDEFFGKMQNLTKRKDFIIALGQYYRWNKELKQVLINQNVAKEVHVLLYQIQETMEIYLKKDVSNKGKLVIMIDAMDHYLIDAKNPANGSLKQAWVTLRYYMRSLTDNEKQVATLHYMDKNAPFIISMELDFKEDLRNYVVRSKQFNHNILLVGLLFIMMVNMVIVALGFKYIKRYIVLPIEEMTKSAQMISDGFNDVKFKKHYNDEIGVFSDHLNQMLSKLRNYKAKMKKSFEAKSFSSKVNKN